MTNVGLTRIYGCNSNGPSLRSTTNASLHHKKACENIKLYLNGIESLKSLPGDYEAEMTKCIEVGDFKSVKTNSKASFPAVDRGQFIQCIVDNMKMRMITM